jgi:hypothetical protein
MTGNTSGKELRIRPEHMGSPLVLNGCSIFSFPCSVLKVIVFTFVLFLLTIALFVSFRLPFWYFPTSLNQYKKPI